MPSISSIRSRARAAQKVNAFDVWVLLERDHKRDIVPFGALLYEPDKNNIWTHPNDTIFIYTEPQTFIAFGATGTQNQISFGARQWRRRSHRLGGGLSRRNRQAPNEI